MDFTTIMQRFAEQSPFIIFLGIVIYNLLKMYKDQQKQNEADRNEHKEELKDLHEAKETELKDFQKMLRDQDSENREALHGLIATLESLKNLISQKL